MQIIILDKGSFDSVCAQSAAMILAGGVIAAPTDTVYGLIGDARNEDVARKMLVIKKQLTARAFPVFVKDIVMARQYGYISDAKARFLEKVWPGAVTAIFHHKEKLPAVLTGGRDTIGMRIPDHPFLLELLVRLDMPLVQTSANISGRPPAKNAGEVVAYFKDAATQPDLIIDGGEISGVSSTVIDCAGVSPLILRSGIMSKVDIDRMLGSF